MSRAEPVVEIAECEYFIEAMSEHDLLEVVEIEETCGLSQWGWEAYRAELDRPESVMLIARLTPHAPTREYAAERVIGFIAARLNAGELHVNNIGVRETARRCGIGSALLGDALEWGAQNGAREAMLEVRAANGVAQSLYRRHGFQHVGRRRNYYREPTDDAIVMRLHLASPA
ncbi:MAG TPA: ribosomal protein S18-alanine N-acetyltransferase [Pyrinomonadaceae bacterium]|jgi:ribosomal-protein-alanine N-acetyltransferase